MPFRYRRDLSFSNQESAVWPVVRYSANGYLALDTENMIFKRKDVLNLRDPVCEIESAKEPANDRIFSTVNLQMLMALYAHREFHDLRAQDVGVERCSCALCLNDDAAIQAALRSAKSRLHSLPSPIQLRAG